MLNIVVTSNTFENSRKKALEILDKIKIIKNNIKELSDENREKTVLYIQNLTKLCKVYYT